MNKIVWIFFGLILIAGYSFFPENLKLKQVFIFSRHNIRNPLKDVPRYTPKTWPPLAGPPGALTTKGAQLEGYMGEYFSEWFKSEHLLPEGCPEEGTVYVYSNIVNRTKESAKAFINSAFKGCNVFLHHKNATRRDPVFQTVIHNTTEAFKEMVLQEVQRKLQAHNSKLEEIYKEMNNILDIEGSEVCRQDGICDLTEANDTILIRVGKPVNILGRFTVAHKSINAFIMNYYDGTPIQDIAWGQITTQEKWNFLTEICRLNQEIRHRTVGKDTAAPLMEYMANTFKNYDEMPKVMLVFGHDTNMNSVATAMDFEWIDLPNQYEKFPIGGKFVFQRWADSKSDYLKVEFVYPSWSQLRNGSKYSLESPPQRVVMRLKWCNTDSRGFCSWNEFITKLNSGGRPESEVQI